MKRSYLKALSIMVVTLTFLSLAPLGSAQEAPQQYTVSFLLQNYPDGNKTYELTITIPHLLYDHYQHENHATYSPSDIAQFVTPNALQPVADRLWEIYNNTEDFTNGVLMLVHQIDYAEMVPGKYPIEVLVDGVGDCDLYAFIAASILEAGGIKSVLLYYKEKMHMEIGVALDSAPVRARVDTFSVTYQGTAYYIGECTGGKWRTGWRIGETPAQYQNISAQVITLDKMEKTSTANPAYPQQVSASIRELDPSTVNLAVSTPISLEKSNVTLSGQVQPQAAGENVTLQYNVDGRGWATLTTVPTDADGRFSYSWLPELGSVVVKASWVGNNQYNGATSAETNITILPIFIVIEVAALALGVVIVVLVFLKTRHRKQKTPITPTEAPSPNQDLPPQNQQHPPPENPTDA